MKSLLICKKHYCFGNDARLMLSYCCITICTGAKWCESPQVLVKIAMLNSYNIIVVCSKCSIFNYRLRIMTFFCDSASPTWKSGRTRAPVRTSRAVFVLFFCNVKRFFKAA